MAGRRRSAADLPRAPLELAHPLAIQDGSPPGAELLAGGAGPYAGLLFKLYRALLDWTASPDRRPACDYSAVRRIEDSLLASLETDPVAPALAVLAGALLRGEGADRAEVAWACLSVSDWAIERGDETTALAFAQLAAWSWPQNARYAWIVARLLFGAGRFREAEPWYRRAHRVAVWTDDWEGQSRALNSLGLVDYERGRFPSSKRHHLRALTVAQRHGVREIQRAAAHNLFVVFAKSGDDEGAQRWAMRAFRLYGSSHPRLAEFFADVAFHWNLQGHYTRTLPVFLALYSRFDEPEGRIRIAAGIARAAGGTREIDVFRESWNDVWHLVDGASPPLAASALYEAGVGALGLPDPELAAKAFTRAFAIASACGAAETMAQAEAALLRVADQQPVDNLPIRIPRHTRSQPGDQLAREFLTCLASEARSVRVA